MARKTVVCHVVKASRLHSVGLLRASDQPDAETFTTKHTTEIHAPGGDLKPQSQQASDCRLTS
jgi:hypothetical protein